MKYKGYELLKAIADGEIKEETKFKCLNEKPMQYYPDSNIYRYEHGNFLGRFGGFNILSIVNKDFEIVRKQEEIDIDSIEKLSKIAYAEINLNKKGSKKDVKFTDKEIILAEKINQLIKAVKQIDKRVKKLERD